MIRKYHNHTLQTNPRPREEEPQNIYSNYSNNIFCLTIIAKQPAFSSFLAKLEWTQITKQRQTQNSPKQWEVH